MEGTPRTLGPVRLPRWVPALLAASLLLPGTACAKRTGSTTLQPPDTKADGSPATRSTATTTTAAAGTPTTAHSTTTQTPPRKGAATTTTSPIPPDTGAGGGAGANARTHQRPTPPTRNVLEVMQQSGAAPLSHTLDHATSVVSANAHKPVSVGAVDLPGSGQDYTADQLRALADQYTKNRGTQDQAVVHVLYLHGTYNGDTSILGLSVRGDTTAVFADQVRNAATPLAPRSTIEDAVTEHELGHLLGLVDLVLHTGRGDPSHPGHSTNKNSVMYWAIESSLVAQVLGGPPPVDFDDADRADLSAIRAGG
jgi:hypothetical protein